MPRERRLTVVRRAAIVTWAIMVVYRTWTTGFAFNREWLLIYICAGLIKLLCECFRRRAVGSVAVDVERDLGNDWQVTQLAHGANRLLRFGNIREGL